MSEPGPKAYLPHAVRMPMRDGVELVANLWLPEGSGPYPTVLLRTPYEYDRANFLRIGLEAYVAAGYAVMFQCVRGLGGSGGTFDFLFQEGPDGYDSIEWIAKQGWSDGRVAMDGGSYLGTVQWLAARERPPHLRCIMPAVAAGDYFREIPFTGGAVQIDWAFSWLSALVGQEFDFEAAGHRNLEAFRPLIEAESKLGWELPLYRDILTHPRLDDYWRRIQFAAKDFAAVEVPAFVATGWFDGDQAGAMYYWEGIERALPRAADSRLIVGPWMHHHCYLGGEDRLEELDCGADSQIDLRARRLAFLDHHMRGAGTLWPERVQLYLTGSQRWLSWPRYHEHPRQSWYLDSDGGANTRAGDGRLGLQPGRGPADAFSFDPRDPVPFRSGAKDHGDLEDRADVLVYSSLPLAEPLSLAGPVDVELWVASDGPDTDFTAKLLDVQPDGRAINLTHVGGVLRARFRDGFERESLLTPGEAVRLTIRLSHVGHCFAAGHRLRLEVSSSSFPLADPNANTGEPAATATTVRTARNTVFHDAGRPSRLLLPVLTGDGDEPG